jgi:GT2 family glycosyltransferase
MDASVIICTYNRWESLKRTLQSLSKMVNPDGVSWEIIVVDNNSQDKTRTVCEDYKKAAGCDLTYVFEERQGLSYARNKGIETAKSEILVFIDDDVIVDRYWLTNIQKAFAENQVAVVGGKILPLWEAPKPPWLIPSLYGMLALLDLGDISIQMQSPMILYGANFAVRSEIFQIYGGFNIHLGRVGLKLFCQEEKDFIHRLQKAGEKILYHPDIIVYHCISTNRLSKSYFRRWKFYAGASRAILLQDLTQRDLVQTSSYFTLKLFYYVLLYLANLIRLSRQRFIYELIIIENISILWHTFVIYIRSFIHPSK